MKSQPKLLAARYAKALFEAAGDARFKIFDELTAVSRILGEFSPVFCGAQLNTAQKISKLEALLKGKTSELMERFLKILIERKRFALLGDIKQALEKLILEEKGIVKAQVVSAGPLPEALQHKIQQQLKKLLNRDVQMDLKEDPALLGGVKVRVGDWIMDGSLRGRLKTLSESLINNQEGAV